MILQVIEEAAPETPAPGSHWRHYKGGLYRVCCIALREEDCREQVVYQRLLDGTVWARDLHNWHQIITLPGGKPTPRFEKVEVKEEGDEG